MVEVVSVSMCTVLLEKEEKESEVKKSFRNDQVDK